MEAEDLPLTAPALRGRRVALVPLDSGNEAWLFGLLSDSELAYRWGRVPGSYSQQMFHERLWNNVLTQLVITHATTGAPVGLVSAWRSATSASTASIGIVLDPGVHRLGWPLEAFLLFMDHLFASYELRKVYADVFDFNLAQYRGAIGKVFTEEGCLRKHSFVAGRYVDVHILAVYREGWVAYRQGMAGPAAGV